ncbi:AAA domain-containing protein [Solwaraspora sp. WMMD1047]|uniref:AAA domain-containing protein n=1 Tax=Solwaraspora sp. WMMD1047 TaxID=3016102 RepID=UPI002415D64A|nr:AAA domain-containing protein [Solwaraspora sp. WMMD1047]MDG4829130.1 AAA domain-containing protein [Solwaraspora sp. WMMD1047]
MTGQGAPGESPAVIVERAASLTDYLLAVRAQMEKPVRTVPTEDAVWQHTLPAHRDCQSGPSPDGATWLRVGLPPAPAAIKVPPDLIGHLAAEPTAAAEPTLRTAGPEPAPADLDWRFERWRDDEWRPWAAEAGAVERTRTLHRRLFDLKHKVDMNTATHELVWGHGILHLAIDGKRVAYPLVVTPVAIDYDPDRALVAVAPQGGGRLQTDPLAGLDERYLNQLLALAGPGGQVDVDPWDDLGRRELYERALRRLGHDPVLREPDGPDPGTPHVHDTAVLFLRPKQRMVRRFLEQLRDRLLDGDPTGVGSLAAILAHEPSRLRMPDDQPDQWAPVGQRLLMPLPTNEAQESIARRLAQHRNVAVQGPPGTGKTHTIRNLICHLMANGKRVLVVAQKEDPLRVLRDGLPAEIRALCLAVLGRSTDQLVQLQLAARELSDRAATLDRTAEQTKVDRLTAQLEEAERELGLAMAGLRAVAEQEASTYAIDGVTLTPGDVGAWLRGHAQAYGDIPDPVSGPAPLTADEFTELIRLATGLAAPDRARAVHQLPPAGELPTAGAVRADRAARVAAAAELDRLAGAGVDLGAVRSIGAQQLDELLTALRQSVTWLTGREGSWTDLLGRLLAEPHWQRMWHDHVTACTRMLGQLAEAARIIGGNAVSIPDALAAEPRRLLGQLGELRNRYAAGKSVGRLVQPALARLAADCRVDGEPLRTTADVDIVVAHVDRARLRQQLAAGWDEWSRRLGIPAPEEHADPEVWVGARLSEAGRSLDWDRRQWPVLHRELRRLVPRADLALDAARLGQVAALLARCPAVFDHDRLAAADRDLAAKLRDGLAQPDASDLWRRLDDAWRDAELTGWDEARAEAGRLAALVPQVRRYLELRGRLAAIAPQWAAAIEAGTAPALAGSGPDCLARWRWRQAQTWFDAVIGSVDPAVLNRRVEQSRERIRRLTEDLVVAAAWLAVAGALDDRRRAALADWTTALRKIGKGTGKSAAAWQGHAQRAMAAAVEAVPVWVMSIDRAVEQFAGGASFDVVIIDEASQADMFALPVLTLASRAVVVGDDQQIGPQLTFVGSVAGLIGAHLADVPSAEHFDPEGSLYDHAVRRSPERILLTEHFRCVPQIIEFSSRQYYDGKIEPLRTDRVPGIGEPVVPVHVPAGVRQSLAGFGDVNVPEAEALVERLAGIVADEAYAGRTLGVVSLLSSSGQALYLLSRIRQEIGEEEMERRRLRVGDAYTFQGDERDVVLVSLVASPHAGPIAAFTKRDYHRRINVAASRARDQLWIFHSMTPDDLRPDDARAALLTYAQHVTSAETTFTDLEQCCDSEFEREVLRRMLLRGLRPLPQFRIGGYRIDFVLPAPDGRRLAVECDGDAYHGPDEWASDMRRQAVLERVGNCVFVRVRGSVFSRDPDAALEPLWRRIEELGIAPEPPPPPAAPQPPAAGFAFSAEQQDLITRLLAEGKPVTIRPDGSVADQAAD